METNKKPIFAGKMIIAADDIEINRDILSKMLEETGICINFARNGMDVIVMFEDNPQKYDLLLTDINMPGMDGYETTRRIRAMEGWGKEIPIIAMTANVTKNDIDKCLEAGMNEHIGKPLEINELIKKIQKYLA
ncbi:MAG: response regulator [Treponema sp.]|nr:response regulator [Treponema sp.]